MTEHQLRFTNTWYRQTIIDGAFAYSIGLDGIRILSAPQAHLAEFTLHNLDGQWDNDAIHAGQDIMIARAPGFAWRYPYRGIVIRAKHNIGNNPTVDVTVANAFTLLSGKNITHKIGSPQRGLRVDQCINRILQAADFPASIEGDNGRTKLDMWPTGPIPDAMAEIERLMRTEGPGAIFNMASSWNYIARFRSRHWRYLNSEGTNVQQSYGTGQDKPIINTPVLDDGHSDIINTCETTVHERQANPYGEIWRYEERDGSLYIRPNEARVVTASIDDPFTLIGVIGPPLHYTLAQGTLASASVTGCGPTSMELTFTAGAGGAVVQDIYIMGVTHSVVETRTVRNSIDMSDSIATYGEHKHTIDIDPGMGYFEAQDLCDAVVLWYGHGRHTLTFDVEGGQEEDTSDDAITGYRIHANVKGYESDMWIHKYTHTVYSSGWESVKIKAEEVIGKDFSQVGSGTWASNTWGF